MFINNEDDLGKAVKNNQNTIEVEGDLAHKVIRIKATGKIAWAIVIGAIGIALASIATAPGTAGASTAANFLIAPVAAASLGGVKVFISAVLIAVAGGGVGALNKLRKYKLDKISEDHVILRKK